MIKLITPLTKVDSVGSLSYTVGSVTQTKEGNEYIYLPGVASVAQYDWVTFVTAAGHSFGSVTRLAASAKGQVGIAQGAIIEGCHGWFQIKGTGWGKVGAIFSAGSALYSCGTTATVTDAVVSGDLIAGAFALGSAAAGGTALVSIGYPYVTDTLS